MYCLFRTTISSSLSFFVALHLSSQWQQITNLNDLYFFIEINWIFCIGWNGKNTHKQIYLFVEAIRMWPNPWQTIKRRPYTSPILPSRIPITEWSLAARCFEGLPNIAWTFHFIHQDEPIRLLTTAAEGCTAHIFMVHQQQQRPPQICLKTAFGSLSFVPSFTISNIVVVIN